MPRCSVAPVTGWRWSTRLARDNYCRIEIVADLHQVRVFCIGQLVADHDRLWVCSRDSVLG
jgi:hypothetical protein